MGYADYYLSGRTRIRKMCKNISDVFGEGENKAKKIVRQNLQNHLRNILELIKYPQIDRQSISSFVHYEGIAYLNAALEKGNGVILLTAHFGAKQFLQVALGLGGYPLNQINFHMGKEELSYIQKKISQKQRVNIEKQIPINFISAKGFLRPVFNCLKKNEILIIAGDGIGLKRHIDKSYSSFDFLGKKMLFPTRSASLAKRTGALIVPVFVVRETAKHRIFFELPLSDSQSDSQNEELSLIGQYVQSLEKYVRKYPSLWEFWEEFDEDNIVIDLLQRDSNNREFEKVVTDIGNHCATDSGDT